MRLAKLSVPLAVAAFCAAPLCCQQNHPWRTGTADGNFPDEPASPNSNPAMSPTASAKTHYNNAVAAIDKGDWVTAQKELLLAARLAPKNALVHYDLALAYDHNGNTAAATEEVRKALSLGLPDAQRQDAEKLTQRLKDSSSQSPSATTSEGAESTLTPIHSAQEISAWLTKFTRDYGYRESPDYSNNGYFYKSFQRSAISFPDNPCKAVVTLGRGSITDQSETFEVSFESLEAVTPTTYGVVNLKSGHAIPQISCHYKYAHTTFIEPNLPPPTSDTDQRLHDCDISPARSELGLSFDTDLDLNRFAQAANDLMRVCASGKRHDIY